MSGARPQPGPRAGPPDRKRAPLALLAAQLAALLVCDAAALTLQPGQTAAAAAPAGTPWFGAEPEDSAVLLGGSARLACSIDTAGARVLPYWTRDNFRVSDQFGPLEAYSKRYRVPRTDWARLAQPGSGSEAPNRGANNSFANNNDIQNYNDHNNHTGAPTAGDYTLEISRAELLDDAVFACSFDHTAGEQQRYQVSRLARLRVLKPPAKLELFASELASGPQHWGPSGGGGGEPRPLPVTQPDGPQQPARLVVRQNARLRLECRSDEARPPAQLAWLDHLGRKVATEAADSSLGPGSPLATAMVTAPASASASASPTASPTASGQLTAPQTGSAGKQPADSLLHEGQLEASVRPSSEDGSLTRSSLAWSFVVRRQLHQDQLLTCGAQHEAGQLGLVQAGSELASRSLRLEVQHEPEVSLAADSALLLEHSPLRLRCEARARPQRVSFAWFIDGALVSNATGSELHIARVTRQLHQRTVRCQATNALGSGSDSLRLSVRYPPAYVGHLLAASGASVVAAAAGSGSAAAAAAAASAGSGQPGRLELALGQQLALALNPGQDATLRCDFDANPRVHQVVWFKLETNYSALKDVTPAQAEQLIESGAARARFRLERDERYHHKRHIAPGGAPQAAEWAHSAGAEAGERRPAPPGGSLAGQLADVLDFEQMSAELLDELEALEWANGTSGAPAWREQVPGQASGRLQEPLAWRLEPAAGGARLELYERGQPATAQLNQRDGQLSSSQLELSNVNEDSAAKYVCRAAAEPSAPGAGPAWFARALYVVMRARPRIVTATQQWAPLGARQVRLVCLAQVNAVADNHTSIVWSRNGLRIGGSGPEQPADKYWVSERRSPDLLFLRSVLHINQPDMADFGLYNCTVLSALEPDHTLIRLSPSEHTGIPFAVMSALATGSVLVLACVLGLLLACTPRAKLDAKTRALAGPSPTPARDPLGELWWRLARRPNAPPKTRPAISVPLALAPAAATAATGAAQPADAAGPQPASCATSEASCASEPGRTSSDGSHRQLVASQPQTQPQPQPPQLQTLSQPLQQHWQPQLQVRQLHGEPEHALYANSAHPDYASLVVQHANQQPAYQQRLCLYQAPLEVQHQHQHQQHLPEPHYTPAVMHAAQVVPTSQLDDAYFESNYGTLISTSSAYKTLGYPSPARNGLNHSLHSHYSGHTSHTNGPDHL